MFHKLSGVTLFSIVFVCYMFHKLSGVTLFSIVFVCYTCFVRSILTGFVTFRDSNTFNVEFHIRSQGLRTALNHMVRFIS